MVEGASNAEIRSLTIACTSNTTDTSCQGMSLNAASPRLTQLRILVQGTGTGAHWGIRTFDSSPILDDVEVLVTASTGYDNYGIVYGGSSTMNILRSNIVARNATTNNWAILLKRTLSGVHPTRRASRSVVLSLPRRHPRPPGAGSPDLCAPRGMKNAPCPCLHARSWVG